MLGGTLDWTFTDVGFKWHSRGDDATKQYERDHTTAPQPPAGHRRQHHPDLRARDLRAVHAIRGHRVANTEAQTLQNRHPGVRPGPRNHGRDTEGQKEAAGTEPGHRREAASVTLHPTFHREKRTRNIPARAGMRPTTPTERGRTRGQGTRSQCMVRRLGFQQEARRRWRMRGRRHRTSDRGGLCSAFPGAATPAFRGRKTRAFLRAGVCGAVQYQRVLVHGAVRLRTGPQWVREGYTHLHRFRYWLPHKDRGHVMDAWTYYHVVLWCNTSIICVLPLRIRITYSWHLYTVYTEQTWFGSLSRGWTSVHGTFIVQYNNVVVHCCHCYIAINIISGLKLYRLWSRSSVYTDAISRSR